MRRLCVQRARELRRRRCAERRGEPLAVVLCRIDGRHGNTVTRPVGQGRVRGVGLREQCACAAGGDSGH